MARVAISTKSLETGTDMARPSLVLRCLLLLLLAGAACAQPVAPAAFSHLLGIPSSSGVWDMQLPVSSGRLAMVRIANNYPDLSSPMPYAYDKAGVFREATRKLTNLDLLRKRTAVLEAELGKRKSGGDASIASQMREVAMVVDDDDSLAGDPLQDHWSTLKSLPDYSRIHFLAPEFMANALSRALQGQRLESRSSVLPIRVVEPRRSPTRDEMLVGRLNGQGVLFAPIAFRRIAELSESDTPFSQDVGGTRRIVLPLPMFIRGSNFLVAETENTRFGFLGEEEVIFNEAAYLQAFGFKPQRHGVLELLRAAVGVDEIVVLPNTRLLSRIDLALVALNHKVVGIIKPMAGEIAEEDRQALARIRATLAELGFAVVSIPTTASRMGSGQSPVNVVTFVNRDSGEQIVMMPLFPDETVEVEGNRASLNMLTRAAYVNLGFEVVSIAERAGDFRGTLYPLD